MTTIHSRRAPVRITLGMWAAAILVGGGAGCEPPPGDVTGAIAVRASALAAGEITIPPGGTMNYIQCAPENGTCNTGSGFRYVAFGMNGSYVFKSLSGAFACIKDSFGGVDPIPNVVKACYLSGYGSNSFTVPQLALQGETSSANGDVAYGANGAFFYKSINGSFTCDDATFGNPISGNKACYVAVPPYTEVASEGDPMYDLYNTPVAFGASGRFIYQLMTGTTSNFRRFCTVDEFGGDPAPQVPKKCYKLTTGNLFITNYSYITAEGFPWSMSTSDFIGIFYGSGRNGALLVYTAGTSGTCDNTFGDPDVGFGKFCWAAPTQPVNQGVWTKVTAPFPGPAGPRVMQLLMDGTVLASDSVSPWKWYRLRPDTNGHYAGGTWQSASITSHYGRAYFATGMMINSKYFIGGGEGIVDNTGASVDLHSKCEVFDPAGNSGNGRWSDVPDFPNSTYLGDGLVAPLPNGRLLVGLADLGQPQSMEFDPSTSSWVNGTVRTLPSVPGAFSEGSFAQLQTGSVFLAENHAALYTSQNWSTVSSWPANNPFDTSIIEGASALTLYSGKVMITGATGFNAIYDPISGNITNVSPTPFVPTNTSFRGHMQENCQAVMPTGSLLINATNDYMAYKFLEYDPSADRFTDVSFGGPDFSLANGVVFEQALPDGTMLVSHAANRGFWVYTPATSQLTSFGRPTITSVTGPSNGVYTLNGTTLNGLTNGANVDDEAQNYTSFPIVWLVTATQTRYAQVTSVSTTSIAPGASGTVKFKIPSGMVPAHGTATVRVSASGLFSSNSKTLTY